MSSAKRDYQEKRNFIRMKIETPAQVQVSADGSHYEGVCRDLSGGGMMIELNTTLPVGTITEVSISSGHGDHPMLKAKTKVTRVIAQPDSEEQPCTLGMEIVEVVS